MWTDIGFSIVRCWLLSGNPTAPSGMWLGTGSGTTSFSNIDLESGMSPTVHGILSKSGIGYTAQFEWQNFSGDITTGSIAREIGMVQAGSDVHFWRELVPDIELAGSTIVNAVLTVNIL